MEKYLAVEEYSVIVPCSLIEIVHWENLKSGGTNHNFSFVNISPLKIGTILDIEIIIMNQKLLKRTVCTRNQYQ